MEVMNQIKQNRETILHLVFSFFGVVGIIKIVELGLATSGLTNSFIAIPLFILFFIAYRKKPRTNRHEKIFTLIFTVFLSTILVLGGQLEFTGSTYWNVATLLKIICACFAFYPIIIFLIAMLGRVRLCNIRTVSWRRLTLIASGIILFGGVLVWLALWPGVYGWDSAAQMGQIHTGRLSAHWSALFGFLFVNIFDFGSSLFNSPEAGLALFCFLQMLVMTYVATRITMFATRRTQNWYVYILSILFFAFFPFYTLMTVYSTQDTLFSAVFALIVLHLTEIILDSKNYWRKIYKPILLAVLVLLLCMLRPNGVYCIILIIPFALALCKGRRIAISLVLLIPLGIFQIYNGPVLTSLGIKNYDGMKEMMSVPSQQLSRTYSYNPELFDEQEKEDLQKFYNQKTNLEGLSDYAQSQAIADHAKGAIDKEYLQNNLGNYLVLWGKIGIESPHNYADAFLLNTLGYWYPNKNYPDDRILITYLEYDMAFTATIGDVFQPITLERYSRLPQYEWLLQKIINNNRWEKIPIVSSLATLGTYFLLIIFLTGMIIVRRDWKKLLILSPILGLYLTIFMGPVALFRYCFPVVLLLPLWVAILLTLKRRKNE